MHRPEVGLDVSVATRVVHGSGGVGCLREIVQIGYEPHVHAVTTAPSFVQRGPCHERGMVAVALYNVDPLCQEVAHGQFVVDIQTPTG